jgi:hypothetical protein
MVVLVVAGVVAVVGVALVILPVGATASVAVASVFFAGCSLSFVVVVAALLVAGVVCGDGCGTGCGEELWYS